MNISDYQNQAIRFAIYPKSEALWYTALGLCGEAGEVAEKVKKIIRDKNGTPTPTDVQEISKELGDVLWYISSLASELGLNMTNIAAMNLEKLDSRKQRGKLKGSGDNR